LRTFRSNGAGAKGNRNETHFSNDWQRRSPQQIAIVALSQTKEAVIESN
jgi:hypothetical protein